MSLDRPPNCPRCRRAIAWADVAGKAVAIDTHVPVYRVSFVGGKAIGERVRQESTRWLMPDHVATCPNRELTPVERERLRSQEGKGAEGNDAR